MSPVTKNKTHPGDLYEVYTCVQRLHQGPAACSQPPIKRAAIDGAIWRYFERVALDVESTRQTVVEHAARKLAEFDALRHQAELELIWRSVCQGGTLKFRRELVAETV